IDNFRSHGGRGVTATVNGAACRLGSPEFVGLVPAREYPGKSLVGVSRDNRLLGWIAFADELRPTSRDAVALLRGMGIEPVIVSGDGPGAVERVARELGIARWRAGVSPEGKALEVKRLRDQKRKIGMAGDGVNDAPALAIADVSFALASG